MASIKGRFYLTRSNATDVAKRIRGTVIKKTDRYRSPTTNRMRTYSYYIVKRKK